MEHQAIIEADVSEVDESCAGRLSFCEMVSVLDTQPQDVGFTKTVVFFNDSEKFTWERPQELVDLRTGVICSPNNYGYTSEEGQLPEGIIRVTAQANFDQWEALSESQYRVEKANWYDRMIESAVRFVPDFRHKVVATDMFTPKTIRRFTWHDGGTVYGATHKQLDGATHLDNLHICGTDQGFIGIIGAMTSGVAIANHCLSRQHGLAGDRSTGNNSS